MVWHSTPAAPGVGCISLPPHDHAPVVGFRLLLLYFPSSPGTSPSLRAIKPPPSESSDDGVVQHPSMLHRRWTAFDAHRTLLVPRLRAWSSTSSSSARSSSNTISRGSHTSSHMRLYRVFSSLKSVRSRRARLVSSLLVSFPHSRRRKSLPQVRDKSERETT